jgi:hypothetical protein
MTEIIPKIIIIVPYRDRVDQRKQFINHMPTMVDHLNYKIMIIHQYDKRLFNRGAIKNIGFLAVKEQYPNHYKNITLVFNDIDTMPQRKYQFSYDTVRNSVNHFYGFIQTLGGIFAIKGSDFEKLNGFPNIWTWGLEDNAILQRCKKLGVSINRNEFVPSFDSKKIINLEHGSMRIISPNIESKLLVDYKMDGINTLYNISYRTVTIEPNIEEVLVTQFETPEKFTSPLVKYSRIYDRKGFSRLNKAVSDKHPVPYRPPNRKFKSLLFT